MYTKEQDEIALKEYERLGSIAAVIQGWSAKKAPQPVNTCRFINLLYVISPFAIL